MENLHAHRSNDFHAGAFLAPRNLADDGIQPRNYISYKHLQDMQK